jgi:hypothetical protein
MVYDRNENLPSGSYFKSGKHFVLEGDILTCELENVHGSYIINRKRVYENTQYHNINGVLTPEDYKNSYFITIGNQLGNCLRIITSGLIIADRFNKHPFIIVNKANLLEKELTVITTLFEQYIIYEDIDFEKLDYSMCVSYDRYYGTNYNLICEGIFKAPLTRSDKFGIIQTIYNVIPENTTLEEFVRHKIKIYKSLPLPTIFSQRIKNFTKNNNLHQCVGLHIRHTDNLTDTCKNIYNFNTTYDTFVKKINSLNNTTILICSDDSNITKAILRESSNNVIVPDSCNDSNFQGLYEMYLLSNCKYIIGTNSSTFSYESAFLRGTDIELYESNEWKLYEIEKHG